jgi:hypothetical protein
MLLVRLCSCQPVQRSETVAAQHTTLCNYSVLRVAGYTVTYNVPYFNEQLGEYVFGNKEPFCAELYSPHGDPWAFRPLALTGRDAGFPIWVSVQNHEVLPSQELSALRFEAPLVLRYGKKDHVA